MILFRHLFPVSYVQLAEKSLLEKMAQRFSLPELNLHDPVNLLGFSTAIAATGLITLYGSHKYAELKVRMISYCQYPLSKQFKKIIFIHH